MDSRAVVLGTIELMEKKLEADVNPTERADIFQERLNPSSAFLTYTIW